MHLELATILENRKIRLMNLCIECICNEKNEAYFTKNAKRFQVLPEVLKNMLLDRWDSHELQLFEPLFIHKNMKSAKVSNTNTWFTLTDEKPSLEKLTLCCQLESLNDIFVFTNLQILKIDYSVFNDHHLKTLGKNLPSTLRSLAITYLDAAGVTLRGISALSNLTRLRTFVYEPHDRDNEAANRFVFNTILQMMPFLEMLGPKIASICEFITYGFGFDSSWHPETTPIELSIKHIVLDTTGNIPANITFPNLSELVLKHPVENFQYDERYSSVTTLVLIQINIRNFLGLLSNIGSKLKKVVLRDLLGDVDLHEILRHLPNLVDLVMLDCRDNFSYFTESLESHVQNLEYVCLKFYNPLENSFLGNRLLQLLRAPRLRCLKMLNWYLTVDDFNNIISALAGGEIMQNLKQFIVFNELICEDNYYSEEDEDSISERDDYDGELRKRYDLLQEVIVRHCPSLEDISEDCFTDVL